MIKIDLRNLEIPLLLFLSVCLFVWYFCYQIREITRYFLNRPLFRPVSFPFIYSFLFRQIKPYGIIVLFLFC